MTERSASTTDSVFGLSAFERKLDRRLPTRWLGWRLRLLVLAALLGCVGTFALMRALAASPALDIVLQAGPQARLLLADPVAPELAGEIGQPLLAIVGSDGQRLAVDALLLQRSARWQVDDARRQHLLQQQEGLAHVLTGGHVTLVFGNGHEVVVATTSRGYAGLGLLFWPLAALALLLYLIGLVVVLVRPQGRNLLYLLMSWCQAGSLLFIAIESVRGLGMPVGAAAGALMPRLAFDLFTAAAGVQAFALHPRRVPHAGLIGAGAWGLAVLLLALSASGRLPGLWWFAQGAMLGLGTAALALLSWSYRIEANPFAAVMRRFGGIAVATLLLVTVGVAASAGQPGVPNGIAAIGSVAWYVFFASLLLLTPFLSRSKQVLREFAMLAGISTVATSLDLLFVAIFSLGQFSSLTLAVFLSLGAYAAARQWILNQMVGTSVLTTERTFEQLYRVAREVQEQPARYTALLAQLLRDLFEPLEALRVERHASVSRVVGGGSALVVPVRTGRGGQGSSPETTTPPLALVLRFAHRGKRLFTSDDARLADRIVEQLRRAVAYDQAVERGRNEERQRIAQDLHDDIGARLLTLMYKAPSPEMEDYVRHTLLDLKTLTRGLAASDHRLSHAAAEWKSDLTQRLTAAHVQLGWSFDVDRDVQLSVVQWSALTRVLRELISNAIYHAQAQQVDVAFRLSGKTLALSVADDGNGREPQTWAHGLGLGGVRKRVKLLGGEVHWRENLPRGIVCEVRVAEFLAKR
jgi:signal transduction histidine kinase